MALTSGKIYKIRNLATGKMLNTYASGSPANGTNVVLYTADGSAEQQWKILSTTGGYKLQCQDGTKVLDRYTVSGSSLNNADVWSNTAADDSAQILQFYDAISGSGSNQYRIKLVSNGYYLSSYGSSNGTGTGKSTTSTGNVFWKSTSGQQDVWEFFEVVADYYETILGTREANFSTSGYTTPINKFSQAQCTWYCYGRAYEKTGNTLSVTGNACDWYNNVTTVTNKVIKQPKAWTPTDNCIAVFSGNTFGHVVFIERVTSDGLVYFSEANYTNPPDNILSSDDGMIKKKTTLSELLSRSVNYTILGYIQLK